MASETAVQSDNPRSIDVSAGRRRSSWTYRPHVDIFESADALLLVADIPGARADGIDLSLESGVLTIQADVPVRQHGSAQCTAHEYGVGAFHRRFEIDEAIETDAVTAEYRDGSLTVRLPKAHAARRRRIPVSA